MHAFQGRWERSSPAGRANRRRVTCAVDGDAGDPLLLGQRVVAILGTGLRTAKYKLAILMAWIGRMWCGARLLATMSPVTTLSPGGTP
jgi:hypothetical protein